MIYKENYAVEPCRNDNGEQDGFMAAEYTGKHGKFSAAYAGADGQWHDLAASITTPFKTEGAAKKFIDKVLADAGK